MEARDIVCLQARGIPTAAQDELRTLWVGNKLIQYSLGLL